MAIELSTDAPQGQNPLKRFRGVLDNYKGEERTFDDTNSGGSGRSYQVVVFQFKDVEVLESDEPYPFPIAEISIGFSPPQKSRGGTKWEALAKSLRSVLPPEIVGQARLDELVGKTQEWAQLMSPLRMPMVDGDGSPIIGSNGRQQWGDGEDLAWQVVTVEGVSKAEDLTDYIISKADGKDEKAFYQALLTDGKINSRPDLVTSITERQLVQALIDADRITRDSEGVLHEKVVVKT